VKRTQELAEILEENEYVGFNEGFNEGEEDFGVVNQINH
jgi:hypothetical protein